MLLKVGVGEARKFLYRNQVPCDLLSIFTHWSNLIFALALSIIHEQKASTTSTKQLLGPAQELEAQERPSDTRLRLAPVEVFP